MKALSDTSFNTLNALEQKFDKQLQADILFLVLVDKPVRIVRVVA